MDAQATAEREPADEYFARLRREQTARRRVVVDGYAAGVLEWKARWGGHVVVTPDPTSGGALWRATYYLEDGLTGDSRRESLVGLLEELADGGYTTPAPGTFDVYGIVDNPVVEARRREALEAHRNDQTRRESLALAMHESITE